MRKTVKIEVRERHAREWAGRELPAIYVTRVTALAEALREDFDTSPVTKAEWDAACGDED